MKRRDISTLAILLSFTNHVKAEVGEAKDRVEFRYRGPGAIESHDDIGNKQRVYHVGDFLVIVSFEKGRSVCETFLKREGAQSGITMSPTEVEAVLGTYEKGAVKWKARIESISWETSDARLEAINLFGRLQISTKAYGSRMRALHGKQERLTSPSP